MPNLSVVAFTQLARSYLPTTGAGKVINNLILRLAAAGDIDLRLLVSKEYVGEGGTLPLQTPLGNLPFGTFPMGERLAERAWKFAGLPRADRWVGKPDWLFIPSEAYVPCRARTLMVVNDIRFSEPTIPYGGPDEHRRNQRAWGHWFPHAARRADVIATISEFTKSRLVELIGVDPGKVEVIGCAAEDAFFAAGDAAEAAGGAGDPAFDRPVPGPYLLVVGGLKRSRGADWELAAADRLAARGSPLTIVSAGWDEPAIEADIRRRANVKSLGRVDDGRMVALVRHATAVLFLSTYEGFGIPAVEAMAAGTPAIVSDRTSLPEVAGDGAIVVDPTQADAMADLADLADRLAADPAFRAEWVARGRRRARAFTWEAVSGRLLTVLRERAKPPR